MRRFVHPLPNYHKSMNTEIDDTAGPMDPELKIAMLEGEMELHHDELGWWSKELDFWRSKYLKEHPELDNWEYVRNARKDEEERGF